MAPELRTRHASIDAARARKLLEDARGDAERLRQVYSDCFFDGSVAAAESAALFARNATDSLAKALELADILGSLPTAIPPQTATPLAHLCTFIAVYFSEQECQAPLNTFCYADVTVKRAACRVVFEAIRDLIERKPGELREVLNRVQPFFDGVMTDSEETDRHFVISRFIGLAHGTNSNVREELFKVILEQDARFQSSQSLETERQSFEDYDGFLVFELFRLATDAKSRALVLLRSLVYGLEFGSVGSLNILWTSCQAQVVATIPVIGCDIVLLFLLGTAARLACSGMFSECRLTVSIARYVVKDSAYGLRSPHNVIRHGLLSFCASVGATASSCRDEDVSMSIADILRAVRASGTTSATKAVRARLLGTLENIRRWRCTQTVSFMGLLVNLINLWSCTSQLIPWLPGLKDIMSSFPSGAEDGTGTTASATSLFCEKVSRSEECSLNDTFGALLALVVTATLSHPVSFVRLKVVEALSCLKNDSISLFCLPSFLVHLQHEANGVVSVKIIRDLLGSHSLLQHKETSKIALNACTKFFGQSANNARFNSSSYQVFISTLGYGTEKAPGLATSLLLREVEQLKESFGLTRSPVRACASSAILNLVISRPTRGTNFIPFISQCIAPESMEVAPEASSLCFEAMNIMAEEEVLDSTKSVKIVMKNYASVADVDPKARRSYLKLLGSVSRNSNTKKGAALAKRVVELLRKCITVMKPRPDRPNHQREKSNVHLSWDEVEQAAHSLRKFSAEEILRLAHAADEVLLDVEAEAERKEAIEKECQDFMQEILSLTTEAKGQHQNAAASLMQLLVKLVAHEWENRRRSSFDPGRIGKLRAASDALRRARQARGAADADNRSGNEGFSRVVKGLPTGVVKGVLLSCLRNDNSSEAEATAGRSFAVAVRVLLAAKALSSAFPWVALVEEVMRSTDSDVERRASCLAVLRVVEGNDFELKDARACWFGPESLLFDSSARVSEVEVKELFLGMVQFYPSEAVHRLFKHRVNISFETLLGLIRASSQLKGHDLNRAATGLFPVVICGNSQNKKVAQDIIERQFYDDVLSNCPAGIIEEMLMKDMNESAVVRIACMTQSFALLCQAARVSLAQEDERDLIARIGMAVNSLDAAHRREFVLEVCADTGDDRLREKQLSLAAYVYGVAVFLPETDLALSVAECFCSETERDGVRRTIASIME